MPTIYDIQRTITTADGTVLLGDFEKGIILKEVQVKAISDSVFYLYIEKTDADGTLRTHRIMDAMKVPNDVAFSMMKGGQLVLGGGQPLRLYAKVDSGETDLIINYCDLLDYPEGYGKNMDEDTPVVEKRCIFNRGGKLVATKEVLGTQASEGSGSY